MYRQPADNGTKTGNGRIWLGIVIGFVFALVLGVSGAFTYHFLSTGTAAKTPDTTQNAGLSDEQEKVIDDIVDNYNASPKTDTSLPTDGEKLSYAQIAQKVQPSVCTVLAYYFSTPISSGSGIVLSEDGYIITNAHVITDEQYKKLKITVKVWGGNEEYAAEIIGYDEKSDIGLIKIKASGLVAAEIGDSEALVAGDEVVAIGTPLAENYAGTVTNGIVSGLDREIDSSDTAMKYIQTNAAINPGNSGGALVNMYGQVIGINTAKIVEEGYEGMGFSIPMASTLDIISQLKLNGKVVRPALGITCRSVTKSDSLYFKVPQGVRIVSVAKTSSLAGKVKEGDIITKLGGMAVTDTRSLQQALDACHIGDTVEVELYRTKDGDREAESYTIEITLLNDSEINYEDTLSSADE